MTYITYSPRGFANEYNIKAFDSKAEADEFRSEIGNDASSYVFAASTSTHKTAVRRYKKDLAEGVYMEQGVATYNG